MLHPVKSIRRIATRVQSATTMVTVARDAVRYRTDDCRRHGRTGTETELLPHYEQMMRVADQHLIDAHRVVLDAASQHEVSVELKPAVELAAMTYPRRRDVVVAFDQAADALSICLDAIQAHPKVANARVPNAHAPIHTAYGLVLIATRSIIRIDEPEMPALGVPEARAQTRGLIASLHTRFPAEVQTDLGADLAAGRYTVALRVMVSAIEEHSTPVTIVEKFAIRLLLSRYLGRGYNPKVVDAMATAEAAEAG